MLEALVGGQEYEGDAETAFHIVMKDIIDHVQTTRFRKSLLEELLVATIHDSMSSS